MIDNFDICIICGKITRGCMYCEEHEDWGLYYYDNMEDKDT